MRRLRFAMLALAMAIAIPVALLISLALRSLAFEAAARHQTLAARTFDEMERSLSRFLEEEEARPIDHYGYFLSADDIAEPRSPLSRLSDRPFVVGHFQIDPQGTLHTPLRPDPRDKHASDTLEASTLWAIAELERVVPTALRGPRAGAHGREGAKRAADRTSGFGATITLEQPDTPAHGLGFALDALLPDDSFHPLTAPKAGHLAATTSVVTPTQAAQPGSEKNKHEDEDSISLDEALRSLNVAQKLREERTQKRPQRAAYDTDIASLKRSRSARVYSNRFGLEAITQEREGLRSQDAYSSRRNEAETALGSGNLAGSATSAASADPPRDAILAMREARDTSSKKREPVLAIERKSAAAFAAATDGRAAHSPPSALAPGLPQTEARTRPRVNKRRGETRVEIDPMVGHVAGEDYLLLSRTVLIGAEGVRQGLLIDRRKIGGWLNEQVLADSRLAAVSSLRFTTGPHHDRERSDELDRYEVYRYRHHFAEPFDSLTATLGLRPLAGGSTTRNIYALSALLSVVAAGGLFAVYRMIAVMVRFAEQRNAFVSSVSHELKTPLTAIRMYGEMLRDGIVQSEEKRDEYYRTIHDESERLGRLINNVLEFSQLERGQRELELVVGCVGEVVSEVVSNLTPHAERQGFTLSARVDDDLPPVQFDRDALIQVLFNLTDNAMKYARGGGPQQIEIGCHRANERGRRDPGGQRVVVEVRDFGPGVARRHLSHLFEPFYRAADTGEVAKGTGIGLALVRDLCTAMGAAVTADNIAEGGFRVRVDFQAASA